jgi:phosphoribosylformylglycinamidine cyclo-ligase
MPRAAPRPLTYRAAGVDRAVKNDILAGVRARIRATFQEGALGSGEEFGGLFHLRGYRDPVLVSSIDGVGTKTRLAALCGALGVAGADIVSHGANDVLCQGARALFMLDYVAASSLDPRAVTDVIAGIAGACRSQGVTLLGGETAEMPGVYLRGELDIVGCTVGVVERDQLITGAAIRPGDAIVGLGSDGLHTNGFSLARAALLPRGGGPAAARRALARRPAGFTGSLGDVLLHPHRTPVLCWLCAAMWTFMG